MENNELAVFEQSDSNPYYKQFKDECLKNQQDENTSKKIFVSSEIDPYYFRCFMTQRYFHDQLVIYNIVLAIGLFCLLFVFTEKTFSLFYKFPPNVSGFLITIFLFCGVFCTGIGILFSIGYRYLFKHYLDFVGNGKNNGTLTKHIQDFYKGSINLNFGIPKLIMNFVKKYKNDDLPPENKRTAND